MTKIVAMILTFSFAGGFSLARGQQATADLLTDNDRARIIESVLDLELQTQASIPGFSNITTVSDENIEFIERSWLPKHGFTIAAASNLREAKKDSVVEYLLFMKIYARDELAVVGLSRVTEGRPCFGAAFSRVRNYTYEVRRTPNGWVAQLIREPALMFDFAPKVSPTKRWTPGAKPNNALQLTAR